MAPVIESEVGIPGRRLRCPGLITAVRLGNPHGLVTVDVEGEPAAAASRRVIKAERLWLDGQRHELYPERD